MASKAFQCTRCNVSFPLATLTTPEDACPKCGGTLIDAVALEDFWCEIEGQVEDGFEGEAIG